jgi:hypothetical protein
MHHPEGKIPRYVDTGGTLENATAEQKHWKRRKGCVSV